MGKWISIWNVPPPGVKCSTHRGRPAVAILVRTKKRGYGVVNMRYYCQECLQRKRKRDPKIPLF